MTTKYLAFDLGAESGRALLANFSSGILTVDELHRFPNVSVRTRDGVHWDVLRLWHEMRQGLQLASAHKLEGLGVDTWGVDFALLGEGGALLDNPYHYRDSRTDGIMEQVLSIVPAEEIYAATGVQFMQINTLYQLYAASRRTPKLLSLAEHFVTIPDLLNFWLTGEIACEFSNATTTQFYDPAARDWARPLFERLGLPVRILPRIVQPGTVLGKTPEGIPVIAPACHDTGSAVAAISLKPDSAYISSGTWSLMGAEIPGPVLTEEARLLNFTNEGGVCGTIRLLKNIAGLWLLQQCRRQWEAEGHTYDYADLVNLAGDQPSLASLVDPDHAAFLHPESMPAAIAEFCRRTGQPVPAATAAFVQSVLESLAMKYRYTLDCLERITGEHYSEIRIVGGGARNRPLNQMAADATGRPVVTGPVEATGLGNIAMQLLATGAVSSLQDARAVIDRSFPTETFQPKEPERWSEAYARFRQYCTQT